MILLVNGEQGSAKSTLCRLLRALVDPNKAALRSEPKDVRDLAIAANNAWMIGLDNMSRIGEPLSNALCRLATGGGFATRELYTDAEETIFDAKRPILINGIGEVANRSDLIDRSVCSTLPTIPEDGRRTEKTIWSDFEEVRPAILGALFDAVIVALLNHDTVELATLPRMADAAQWVVAAEPTCPWPAGSFVIAFDDQRRESDALVVEASVQATFVRHYIEAHGKLEGTATQIMQLLSAEVDEKVRKHEDWPKSPSSLSAKLRRIAPNLRRLGIEVIQGRSRKGSAIEIRKAETCPESPSSSSSSSLPSSSGQGPVLRATSGDLATALDDGDGAIHDGNDATAVIGETGPRNP